MMIVFLFFIYWGALERLLIVTSEVFSVFGRFKQLTISMDVIVDREKFLIENDVVDSSRNLIIILSP